MRALLNLSEHGLLTWGLVASCTTRSASAALGRVAPVFDRRLALAHRRNSSYRLVPVSAAPWTMLDMMAWYRSRGQSRDVRGVFIQCLFVRVRQAMLSRANPMPDRLPGEFRSCGARTAPIPTIVVRLTHASVTRSSIPSSSRSAIESGAGRSAAPGFAEPIVYDAARPRPGCRHATLRCPTFAASFAA